MDIIKLSINKTMKNPTKDMLKEMLDEANLTIESLRTQVRVLEDQVAALTATDVKPKI